VWNGGSRAESAAAGGAAAGSGAGACGGPNGRMSCGCWS